MGGGTIQVLGFPSNVWAENVKEFFERYTGEGTVYAVKVRPPKTIRPRSKAFVIVQFTTSSCAKDITSMASQQQLSYEGSYLETRDAEHDIEPKPRTKVFDLEHVTLHFGCQIMDRSFSALWSVSDVRVKFGFHQRKLKFLLSCHDIHYKLELFYGSIRQIQLRHSHEQAAKFLLIRLQAAPRIYMKPPVTPQFIYEDPKLNYFKDKDISGDQWVRATDFTPSSSIGQSSALCLEVPDSCKLPDIHANFVNYEEIEGQFVLESGFSFSHGLDLVPIVRPCQRIQLPYTILFKINSLVQNGIIMGLTLDDDFFRLVDPRRVPIRYVEHALESLSHLKDSCFQPAKWLHEQYGKYRASQHPPKSTTISLDPGLVYVHRVQVTPTKVYFCGPEVNVSNRVLRHYAEDIDNFLRVTFVDEEWDKMRSTDLVLRAVPENGEKHTDIYKRILTTLRSGIVIGSKKFEFLAFSSSQLRENSAWMFAARRGLNAAGIRRWMGDFSQIRNVAKYSARLGQSFGSSKETLSVDRFDIERIPDIEIGKYNFSDGIGKISADLAKTVAIKCDIRGSMPSAYQIRYGGYKGVVAVDPMSPFKLSLRKSMDKYKSDNTKLDVLGWSKYQRCYLNRQLITLLSTLGVRDQVFEMKQKEYVDQLDMILTDPTRAQEELEVMSPGENNRVLREMLMCGYKPDVEPFLSMMLQTLRASKLSELRTKSRIFVLKGRSMMGCLDETRTLEYGQVFVQISPVGRNQFFDKDPFKFGGNESDQQPIVIEGRVFVAKNPCLHPGDIRVLRAVNVPALHHMVDCVVFPQKGKRPHPNECSGSDLDGDVYFVSWDPELIPPRQIPPMEYDAEPPVVLDHDVEIEEVEEYFTNYMLNDSLGVIANAHTVFADKEPLMAKSNTCIELARLFSIAVDFPKTGVPAEIPPNLHVKEYPDFMEKPEKPTYKSTRVIGKLFRAIKDISPETSHIKSFTREIARQSYDTDMEVDGFEDYIDDACWYKEQYDFKLGNLMEHYGIKTEAEIISGSIMKLAKSFMKNRDAAEVISLAVRSLKKEARGWFDEKDSDVGPPTDGEALAKASAWYHVTYHPRYFGTYNEGLNRAHFISFPWCVYDKLIPIKKRVRMRRTAGPSSLQNSFRRNLRVG